MFSLHRFRGTGTSQADRLLGILSDRAWHSTSDLRRRIGPFFGIAVWILRGEGFPIEKRRHPYKLFQWQYRLPPEGGDSRPTVIVRPRHRKE